MQLVRINLSEQTDVSDLFGSDLPVPDSDGADQSEPSEGGGGTGSGARFAWCDGIFLSALKAGKWVLLDELNLATQVIFCFESCGPCFAVISHSRSRLYTEYCVVLCVRKGVFFANMSWCLADGIYWCSGRRAFCRDRGLVPERAGTGFFCACLIRFSSNASRSDGRQRSIS